MLQRVKRLLQGPRFRFTEATYKLRVCGSPLPIIYDDGGQGSEISGASWLARLSERMSSRFSEIMKGGE